MTSSDSKLEESMQSLNVDNMSPLPNLQEDLENGELLYLSSLSSSNATTRECSSIDFPWKNDVHLSASTPDPTTASSVPQRIQSKFSTATIHVLPSEIDIQWNDVTATPQSSPSSEILENSWNFGKNPRKSRNWKYLNKSRNSVAKKHGLILSKAMSSTFEGKSDEYSQNMHSLLSPLPMESEYESEEILEDVDPQEPEIATPIKAENDFEELSVAYAGKLLTKSEAKASFQTIKALSVVVHFLVLISIAVTAFYNTGGRTGSNIPEHVL